MKLLLLAVVLMMAACSKDKGDSPATPQELLMRSPWKLTRVLWEANGVTYPDIYNNSPQCTLDNEHNFWEDGTHTITEGESRCGPQYPTVVASGTWQLLDDVILTIEFPGNGQEDWDLITLNQDSLVVTKGELLKKIRIFTH